MNDYMALFVTAPIIRVTGADSASYLQGLMTNDIDKIVTENWPSLYCMFLNVQGRILFDANLYRGSDKEDFLLDIDQTVAPLAIKHLGFYKIRKKVKIENLQDKYKVYAAYQKDVSVSSPVLSTQSPEVGSTFCNGGEPSPGHR